MNEAQRWLPAVGKADMKPWNFALNTALILVQSAVRTTPSSVTACMPLLSHLAWTALMGTLHLMR